MKKKLVVLLVVLVITMLLILGFWGIKKIINDYRRDRLNTKAFLSEINENYKKFEDNIEPYNQNLTELLKILNSSTYYESFFNNREKIYSLLENITDQIKSIDSYELLKNNCSKTFVDNTTERNCKSFSKTYEKSINVYVDIVSLYNNTAKKANEIYDDDIDFEIYAGFTKKYIDYDNDGEFIGKNVAEKKEVISND